MTTVLQSSKIARITHYNIAMDKVAEQCRTDGSQPTMTTVLQSSKIALVLNSAVITSNVEAAIKHAMKYEPSKHTCANATNGP